MSLYFIISKTVTLQSHNIQLIILIQINKIVIFILTMQCVVCKYGLFMYAAFGQEEENNDNGNVSFDQI